MINLFDIQIEKFSRGRIRWERNQKRHLENLKQREINKTKRKEVFQAKSESQTFSKSTKRRQVYKNILKLERSID